MCAFSPLSLFKAKSKVFAKKNGIKLYAAREQLAQNAGFSSYHSMLASKYKPYFCESLFESTLGIRCLHDIPDEKTASAMLHTFSQLADARISHGDFKATNQLWHDDQVWLIDLDAMQAHADQTSWHKAWIRDRSRFIRNWPAGSQLAQWLDKTLPR